ncbi:MAG: hypothetical protein U0L73_03220 [Ruminococcus bromii]|nr:hypothetical protein [Ruminococcus bromii]
MFKKAISLLLSLMLIITSLSITAISVSAADIKYVVAGTANLCDSTWDFSEESGNIMTEKEDGTYELVFSPTEELGVVQIKVAKLTDGKVQADEDYYGDASGNNITFKVTDAGDVTVTFDPSTKEIKVKGDNVEMVSDLKIDAMRAVGNGDGNWLNGVGWDPADDSNKMTEVSDNVYEISYDGLEAYDNYQVKFAANGSWTDNWGGEFKASGVKTDADYNGGNITIDVPEDNSTVKLTLDLTGFDYASKTGAKFTVTINGEEQEETTVAPTTEAVTTKPEETTAAPAEEGLNVKATSNYFPEFTQHFDASTDTVTVTYFINSEKRMLNSQWKLTYDPSVLKFNADKNVDEDDNWTFMPQAGDAVCNPADAGIIKGNCTSLKLYRLQTKTGGKVPFVSVTFDVVGTGNTTVNLELEVMQIANLDPTTKQEDPDTEETVARGSEILEVSVPITRVAYVYEGTLDPSYEPATEAPTTEAPTTVAPTTEAPTTEAPTTEAPTTEAPTTVAPTTEAPTTEAPTTEAPTTEAPTTEAPTTEAPTTEAPTTEAPTTEAPTTAAGALTVKATSNFFPEFTQSFDADTKSVTVTYFINSEKRMLNSQWTLKYDPSVLQFNAEKNSDADGNWTMMPQASDAMCNPYVDGQPGTIKANCTNLKLYKLQTADGNEVEFVTVTFDVIGSGETTVDLDLEVMQIANLDPTTKLEDESTEEDVVIGSTVLPFTTPIARRTLVTAGKTEPTTEAPTTEAPTTEPSQLLNITAKSNVAADAKYSVNFADDSTKIVTVTYYYQDVKELLSTQWNLSYDPEYLELKTTSGFMPFAGDDAIYNVTDGNVKGSVSNLSLYDFSTKKPYVQLTFEAKKAGNTDVLLLVEDLMVSELDPTTGKSDESKEMVVINNGVIGDLTENAFEAEIIGGTPVQPTTAPVTTEPVTTEPVTTEPVTTEPATTEPATTAPATTAPATTAPATTVAPSTSTDATSASGATTPTSKGQSTSDQTTVKPSTSTGAVQTGNASMALIILSVLISATAAVYFARKKIK